MSTVHLDILRNLACKKGILALCRSPVDLDSLGRFIPKQRFRPLIGKKHRFIDLYNAHGYCAPSRRSQSGVLSLEKEVFLSTYVESIQPIKSEVLLVQDLLYRFSSLRTTNKKCNCASARFAISVFCC